MHARPEVKPILIVKKMQRWLSVLRCPVFHPQCKPARARRNLLRLAVKYPELAAQLGLNVGAIYRL